MTDFQLFIKVNKLKKCDMAEFLDVSNAFVSQLCSGKRKLPLDKYALIKANDGNWDSSMLIEPVKQKPISEKNDKSEENEKNAGMQEVRMVPTIPYTAYKATEVDIMQMINNPSQEFHRSPAVSQFPQTDCHYFVNTDAMIPYLRPNDLLALKKIHDSAIIINGEICVINSRYNGLIARFVYDDGEHLLLKASDTQSRYTDMKLKKEDIYGVYRILGLIRTNI